MNSGTSSAWLGFAPLGERISLEPGDLRRGLSILGKGSEQLSLLLASALIETGSKVVVLDLSGRAAKQLSGYLKAVDAGRVMLDAFKIDSESPQHHGQLIASALTTLFNLPANQESILSSAVSDIAGEPGFASPSAIFDASALVSGHKATDKQEVEGRLASLQMLTTAAEGETLEETSRDGAIVCFADAASPEIGEAGAMFVMSKLLALARRSSGAPDVVILTEAHRIFRSQRFVHHSRRFQDALLSSPIGKVLVSEFDNSLDEQVAGACPLRLLSSSVWNIKEEDRMLDGTFVLQDTVRGSSVPIAPRRFEPLEGRIAFGAPPKPAPPSLTLAILEAVGTNELASKPSVAAWLSVDYDRDEIIREIDRLVRELYVTPMAPPRGLDVSMKVLHLTVMGEQELKRLKGNE